jgi:putative methionine-R-sulfoxide reductase with GAF domain
MQQRLEELVRRFGADTGSLHWIEDGVLVLKGQVGIPPHVVEIVRRVPVGKGMAGLAAQRNAPVSACNVQTDASGDVRPGARDTGVNGAIVVPVRDASGNVRGALGIGVHRVYEYTPEETERLIEEAASMAPPEGY